MRTFYLSPARFFDTMLGNLWQIVIANWDNFSDIIPNQAWLMSRMDDLEMSRNIIMHIYYSVDNSCLGICPFCKDCQASD